MPYTNSHGVPNLNPSDDGGPVNTLARYAKAVVAFLTPAIPLLIQAMEPKSPGRTDITAQEWLLAVGASLAAAGLVALVPNKPKRKTPKRRPRDPEPHWRGKNRAG